MLKDQVALSTNMSEMMIKLLSLETKEDCEVDYILPKHTQGSAKDSDEFKCDICGYKCSKEVTLRKHTNTKHKIKAKNEEVNETSVCDSECSLCDDNFENTQEFKNHIKEHIHEI